MYLPSILKLWKVCVVILILNLEIVPIAQIFFRKIKSPFFMQRILFFNFMHEFKMDVSGSAAEHSALKLKQFF